MILLALVGLPLTVCALALLLVGGYLAAVRLLGEEAQRDALGLAIATLLAATAQALAIGLLLGGLGALRIEWALAAQTLIVAALARRRGGPGAGAGAGTAASAALRRLAQRVWGRLREHPALSLIAAHAVGSEALRGLLRPPLSWDSLMYHLLLTATWLQERNLRPAFGPYPVNDYGFVPANGSIWLWWWMAPSHSELYVNLASIAHWLLLGLAVGGVARQLGARRHWPLASFLVLMTPTVVRFAATQYVDLFLSSLLLAGCFFGLKWLREPRLGYAALAGAGCGLACGAKLFGVPYALALGGAIVLLARGGWRRRVPQAAVALALVAALGSFFYLRNIALGAGPLALTCEGRETQAAAGPQEVAPTQPFVPALPRRDSVVDRWATVGRHQLLDAFLGITRPQSMELGIGPQVFLVLLAFLALPFAIRAGWRREALVAASQIGFELVFWLAVPFSANLHVFANIRYLIPAAGLAFAGGVAMAEQRGMSDLWLRGIAIALACQGMLQLHSEMPHGVRVAIGAADLGAVALGLSAGLRGVVRRRPGVFAVLAGCLAMAGAPFLAAFRLVDRPRALASEWTAHSTSARLFAGGWGWLDLNGGDGTVDVVGAPGSYFVYPAMGPYLERKARYINVNAQDYDLASRYPKCDPRIAPDEAAWLGHLQVAHVRWLLLNRYPDYDFPLENRWAAAHPDRFALRFADQTSLIYEVLPPSPAAAPRAVSP
jgi:hypothetical protein